MAGLPVRRSLQFLFRACCKSPGIHAPLPSPLSFKAPVSVKAFFSVRAPLAFEASSLVNLDKASLVTADAEAQAITVEHDRAAPGPPRFDHRPLSSSVNPFFELIPYASNVHVKHAAISPCVLNCGRRAKSTRVTFSPSRFRYTGTHQCIYDHPRRATFAEHCTRATPLEQTERSPPSFTGKLESLAVPPRVGMLIPSLCTLVRAAPPTVGPEALPRGSGFLGLRFLASKASRRKKSGAASGGDGEDEHRRQELDALNEVVAQVNEMWGKGTMQPIDAHHPVGIEFFPSGILPLDLALGGGWPRGRIVEIYGPESSGKTTLGLYAAAQIQKEGRRVVMVDAEHALDSSYAQKLGVVMDGVGSMIFVQPEHGEQALSIAECFIRSGLVGLVLVDSVSALLPRSEIDGIVGEQSVAGVARLMSAGLRKLSSVANQHKCTVMFMNQIRQKVGIVYGNPEVTSGGHALKFHASVRVRVSSSADKSGKFSKVKVQVKKNKVSRPFREAEFDLVYGEGVPEEACLFVVGGQLGLVKQSGAWYTVGEERFQGREAAIQFLKENRDSCARLEEQIREALQGEAVSATPSSGTVEDEDEFGEEEVAEGVKMLEVEGGLGLTS